MPGSPGAGWVAIKRHRERYAKMTPEQRAEDDRYWARQEKIDRVTFGFLGMFVLLVLIAVAIFIVVTL